MKIKFLALLFLGLLSQTLLAQKSHSKSFGFISDNDVYVSATQDQYYSNGLTLVYQFLPKEMPDKFAKKIYTIQLGHYLYTPKRAFSPLISNQDRPFAGYLFADFGIAKYYKNQSFLKMTYQLGILGPSAQGDELQKWYHRTFGLPEIAGWEYQIKDQIGLNVTAHYLKNLHYFKGNKMDFNAFGQAKVGTIFNELSVGFVSRIGFKALNPIFNTILFDSNLGGDTSNNSPKEFYFFVKPQLTYVAYNATIQGSIFNDNSPVTFDSEPIKGSLEIGMKIATNRFNLSYGITYLTKAVDNDRVTAHKYGTITVAYLFK